MIRAGMAGLKRAGCGVVLGVAAAAGGCEWLDAPEAPVAAAQPRMAEAAELRLSDAALRAERALTTLQRIKSGTDPELGAEIPRLVDPDLMQAVTLDWVGPLASLLESLARQAGYGFEVAGPEPVTPLVVSVQAESRPLIFVLRDAGLQAGSGALVVVDAGSRQVRLDWRPGWESG